MSSLCEELKAATERWLNNARQTFAVPRAELMVRCDLKGRSAGQLRREPNGQWVIRYNLEMARLQRQAFIAQTVPHEIAHWVVWQLHGKRARAHGSEWQSVMQALGQPAERYHNFALATASARQQRRWPYRCRCSEHQLSSTRHNRVCKGQIYFCRDCGAALTPA